MAVLAGKAPLMLNRDKRVEELELRLKSMEGMMKARVSDDVDVGDSSGRPDTRSGNQSEFGNSDSSGYSDPASTVAGGKIRVRSDSSSEGRTGSLCLFPI